MCEERQDEIFAALSTTEISVPRLRLFESPSVGSRMRVISLNSLPNMSQADCESEKLHARVLEVDLGARRIFAKYLIC